jgi:hypothetical protein
MSKDSLYESATPSVSLYSTSTSGTEIDLRQELIRMFNGTYPEIAKSQPALLRVMRKDSDGNKIACGCVDPITQDPDKDRYCPVCMSEGWIWDEEDLLIYRILGGSVVGNHTLDELTKAGLINIPLVVFYTLYNSDITEDDKIVRLQLDTAGSAIVPKKRHSIYKISKAWDYRADNGKIEYWKLYTHKEDVKYLNTPSYEDI